jgi:hypothetical protein
MTMMMICRGDPSAWKGRGMVFGRKERRKSALLEGLEGLSRLRRTCTCARAQVRKQRHASNPSNPSSGPWPFAADAPWQLMTRRTRIEAGGLKGRELQLHMQAEDAEETRRWQGASARAAEPRRCRAGATKRPSG